MRLVFHRELYTTPASGPEDDARAALHRTAEAATVGLHLLCYGFTDEGLADILLAKRAAGLTVEVAVDHTQSTGKAQRALLQRLVDGGVLVVVTAAPSGQIAHSKVLLKDMALGAGHPDSCAVWGSYNFTGSEGHEGAAGQFNTLELDHSSEVCSLYYAQFLAAKTAGMTPMRVVWQIFPSAPAPAPVPTGGQQG